MDTPVLIFIINQLHSEWFVGLMAHTKGVVLKWQGNNLGRPKGRNQKEVKSPARDCMDYGTGALPQTPEFIALKPPACLYGSKAMGAARGFGLHGCFVISAMTVAILYPDLPEA